jgi:hypothetical protein
MVCSEMRFGFVDVWQPRLLSAVCCLLSAVCCLLSAVCLGVVGAASVD